MRRTGRHIGPFIIRPAGPISAKKSLMLNLKKGVVKVDVESVKKILRGVVKVLNKSYTPEAVFPPNTLMETKTVIKDKDNKDAGQEREAYNSQLDCPPKRFLSSVIDRWHCVADHDVAEENNPDRDKSVECEEKGSMESSEEAENFGNTASV